MGRANQRIVTTGKKADIPQADAQDIAQAWRELRADGDIQFREIPETPVAAAKPPEPPPDWLVKFLNWLDDVFSPVGRALSDSWPVLQWVLLALGVLLAAYILWRLFGPDLAQRRRRAPDAQDWAPDAAAALALLDEADRLAADGRFDEATHLLLQRSVGQIAEARPDLVEPSSTAREIAAQPALPEKARGAFAVIADRVERSLFALRRLSLEDWQAARAAYADFALAHTELAVEA